MLVSLTWVKVTFQNTNDEEAIETVKVIDIWEHFSEWKKINSEGEEGIISLETIVKSTCDKKLLLDIIENFTFFYTAKGELVKREYNLIVRDDRLDKIAADIVTHFLAKIAPLSSH